MAIFIYILFEHILKLSSPRCISVIGDGAGQRVKGSIWVMGIVKIQGECLAFYWRSEENFGF